MPDLKGIKLSRFPGHSRRKGKKRSRKNVEKKEVFDDTLSAFQRNPELQQTPAPRSGGSPRDDDRAVHAGGDAGHPAAGKAANQHPLNSRTGKRNASSISPVSGRQKQPAGEHAHGGPPSGGRDKPVPANAFGASRPNGKQKRRRRHNGEAEIRGLRGPVEPAPDVVYHPGRGNAAGGSAQRGETAVPDHGAENRPHRQKRPQHPGSRADHKRGGNEAGGRGRKQTRAEPGRRHGAPASHGRPARNTRPLYAALDLGTNNCRLLIALPQQKGRFRVIDGFSRIVRLGEGMAQSGELSQAAMDRALEALKVCAGKLISHDISRHRLIATEACRQAGNGKAFLDRVYEHTGMKLEIIDRKTEAYLAAEGCGSLIDRKAEAAVLFDIGGGSSELVLVRRGRKNAAISEQILDWTSLQIGVVTLAERFGGKMVDQELFERMVEEVRVHLAEFADNEGFSRVWRNGRVHLLGTSGTVTTLAGIHLDLPRYERRLVDGLWMRSDDIDTVLRQLIAMDYDQRASSPCIGQERADLVMAGCAILEAIRRTWPCQTLRVADRGLREGALTQLMSADNAWLPPKKGRWVRKKQR